MGTQPHGETKSRKAKEKIAAEKAEKAEKAADATEKATKEQLQKDRVAEEKAAKLKEDSERATQPSDSQSVQALITQADKERKSYLASLTVLNTRLKGHQKQRSQRVGETATNTHEDQHQEGFSFGCTTPGQKSGGS